MRSPSKQSCKCHLIAFTDFGSLHSRMLMVSKFSPTNHPWSPITIMSGKKQLRSLMCSLACKAMRSVLPSFHSSQLRHSPARGPLAAQPPQVMASLPDSADSAARLQQTAPILFCKASTTQYSHTGRQGPARLTQSWGAITSVKPTQRRSRSTGMSFVSDKPC